MKKKLIVEGLGLIIFSMMWTGIIIAFLER